MLKFVAGNKLVGDRSRVKLDITSNQEEAEKRERIRETTTQFRRI
jgi:hypothetical protein